MTHHDRTIRAVHGLIHPTPGEIMAVAFRLFRERGVDYAAFDALEDACRIAGEEHDREGSN